MNRARRGLGRDNPEPTWQPILIWASGAHVIGRLDELLDA